MYLRGLVVMAAVCLWSGSCSKVNVDNTIILMAFNLKMEFKCLMRSNCEFKYTGTIGLYKIR